MRKHPRSIVSAFRNEKTGTDALFSCEIRVARGMSSRNKIIFKSGLVLACILPWNDAKMFSNVSTRR